MSGNGNFFKLLRTSLDLTRHQTRFNEIILTVILVFRLGLLLEYGLNKKGVSNSFFV